MTASALGALPPVMASKVAEDTDTKCWTWTGATQSSGYGCGRDQGGAWLAHRRSYELLIGPIPEGLTIDHLCRNKKCINPAHMEPVTSAVNTRRGIDHRIAEEPTYPCGHERTESNTITKTRANGWINRTCRECNRIAVRKWRQNRAGAMSDDPQVLDGSITVGAVA